MRVECSESAVEQVNKRNTIFQFEINRCSLLSIFCSVQVTGILNDAAVAPDENAKLNLLLKAKEVLLYQEPKLLPQFINDVIAYQNDLSSVIRKFVVSFIEECW